TLDSASWHQLQAARVQTAVQAWRSTMSSARRCRILAGLMILILGTTPAAAQGPTCAVSRYGQLTYPSPALSKPLYRTPITEPKFNGIVTRIAADSGMSLGS